VARHEIQLSSAVIAAESDQHHQYNRQQNLSPISTASDLTLIGDQGYSPFENMADMKTPRPAKRQRTSEGENSTSAVGGSADYENQMKPGGDAASSQAGDIARAAANKPKRVRTGCLTCRERHLKCDEGLPNCQNCRKSNRTCKRGVRLNFIDTQVQSPSMIPPTADWAGEWFPDWALCWTKLTLRSGIPRRI
jgi:hypothetical protein